MQSSAIVIAVFEFVLLLFSLSVHEAAHAWTASRLGDQTARMLGRVSLNPMDHVDPIGTLLLPALMIFGPLLGFGYFGALSLRMGQARAHHQPQLPQLQARRYAGQPGRPGLEPAAGLDRLFSAWRPFFFSVSHLPEGVSPSTTQQSLEILCNIAMQLNLTLCIFNLLPIPPLDGSHVLRNVLPYGAVRVFDSITGPLSYLLLIFVGRFVLGIVMTPILSLAYAILAHI